MSDEIPKLAKLRIGMHVSRDFRLYKWPLLGANKNQVFSVKELKGGRIQLTAPGFGGRPYGNGALYCTRQCLKPVPGAGPAGVT